MKQADWNHNILNEIDPALVECAAAPAKKHSLRPVRIAVAAACLCVALVGGAFAAEAIWGVPVFTPMDTSPMTGEEFNGFTTVIEVPEEVETPDGTKVNPLEEQEINGVFKLPVESFSQRVQDAAANLAAKTLGQMNFNSWEKAEEFLGLDLMNNAVLADAEPGLVFYGDGNSVREAICQVHYTAIDGILTGASANSVWFLNYVDMPVDGLTDSDGGTIISSSVPVRVEVLVQSYTKHSPIAPEDMFVGLGFPKNYTFTPETYTTPSGLVVNIVGVNYFDKTSGEPITEYYAQFAFKGNAVTVSSAFLPDSDHALATLKQVLDAFE